MLVIVEVLISASNEVEVLFVSCRTNPSIGGRAEEMPAGITYLNL